MHYYIMTAAAAAKSLQSCPPLCHRRQPTRLPCPWDSPGKNTGVGCNFLLHCMKDVGGATCRKTTISRSTLEKNQMPAHLFEGKPVDEGTTRRGTDTRVHRPEKPAGPTDISKSGLSPCKQLERQTKVQSSTED